MHRTKVDLFADPVCPFAWIAYRWLVEVEESREVELSLRLMSLAILNDGTKGYQPEEERGLDSAWRPVRVAAAVEAARGQDGLRGFFAAFGLAFHVEKVRPRDVAIRVALEEVAAPEAIAAADETLYDVAIHESHDLGVEPVGLPGGTPILHLDGAAFFGPVLNATPVGAEALEMFDGARLLAKNPQFSEMKRARPAEIVTN